MYKERQSSFRQGEDGTWLCSWCDTPITQDRSKQHHKLTVDYISFRVWERKEKGIPTTHLFMSEKGKVELAKQVNRLHKKEGSKNRVSVKSMDQFRGMDICISSVVPDSEIIPAWVPNNGGPFTEEERIAVVDANTRFNTHYPIDWMEVPLGTYCIYKRDDGKNDLVRYQGFIKQDKDRPFDLSGTKLNCECIDHFTMGYARHELDPDERRLNLFFIKDIEKYSRRNFGFCETAMRPATTLEEISPYWGEKVEHKDTGEIRKFDRVELSGEFSLRWWYDNYRFAGRPIGVGVFTPFRLYD